MITSSEHERYSRQIAIKDFGEATQKKLKRSRVLVAGAGGLGSPVIYYLAAAGIGEITVCDFDTVSISNLNRQILHSQKKIGMLKVESASERIKEFNPDIKISSLNVQILDSSSIMEDGFDCVVDCLDNNQSRLALNEYCFKRKIPLVHGAISGFSGRVTFIDYKETPCLNCFLESGIQNSPVNAIGSVAGIIGSIQSLEVIKCLTGLGETLSGRLMYFDGLTMQFEKIKINKKSTCSVCGKN